MPAEHNPRQKQTLDRLRGLTRRTWEDGVSDAIRSILSEGIDPLGITREISVKKDDLLINCEGRYLARQGRWMVERPPFDWTPENAKGTVFHKAAQLALNLPERKTATELVDMAIRDCKRDGNLARWLKGQDEGTVAILRSNAIGLTKAWLEAFPALPAAWEPETETRFSIALHPMVTMNVVMDLAIGTAVGNRSSKLIVDWKTGARLYPDDIAGTRVYALAETLRTGLPPFGIAVLSVASGEILTEEVTPDTLESTADAVVSAVARLHRLSAPNPEPKLAPSNLCRWCDAYELCGSAKR